MAGAALPHLLRPAAGIPRGALVLLHGRGADEHDLHGLLDLLDPERRLLGVTAGGPFALPPGGRHWYVVREVGFPDADSFLAAHRALGAFVDGLGFPPADVLLGGFSQGAAMSWALALDAQRPAPRGVIALSGFIPTVAGLELADRALPVAIGHGSRDEVVPVRFGRAARDRLQAAGADVTYHESETGHQIDPRFLTTLPGWIQERFTGS